MLKMLWSFRRFQHKRVGISRLYVRSSLVLSKGQVEPTYHSWLLLSRFYTHTVRGEKGVAKALLFLLLFLLFLLLLLSVITL